MPKHVKTNDTVKIIAGNDKDKTGEVLKVLTEKNMVLVKGINLVYKHVRPSKQNPQGGRLQVERPVHISNVLPVNPSTKKASRVTFKTDAKGQKSRTAVDGTVFEVISKTKK